MLRLIVCSTVVLVTGIVHAIESPNELDPRVTGGDLPAYDTFTVQLKMAGSAGAHLCGASLIAPRFVLTAAQCVAGRSAASVKAVVGRPNLADKTSGIEMSINKITVHPSYTNNGSAIANDIAVLTLSGDVPFFPFYTPVLLNGDKAETAGHSEAPGTVGTLTGWGQTSASSGNQTKLRAVSVPVVARATCATAYKDTPGLVRDTTLCAGASGKLSCKGDRGGPLFISSTSIQTGVISKGVGCTTAAYRPDVHTRVSSYIPWIKGIACVGGTGPFDDLRCAAVLSGGVSQMPVSTLLATREAGEPVYQASAKSTASIWFKTRIAKSGSLYTETYFSATETVMAVYRSPSFNPTFGQLVLLGSSHTCQSCLDEGQGDLCNSCVEVPVVAGQYIFVSVSDYKGSKGDVSFTFNVW